MLTARTTAIRRSIVTPPCPFAPAAYCKIRAVGSVPEHFNAAAFFVDRHLAEGRGAQTAFRFAGRGISYADLAASVDRCANGLAGLGVEIEHRVVLALNDSPAFAAAFWGTTKLGAVAVPVNTLMTPAEYEFLLTDSRARVAVVEAPVAGRLLAVRHRCPSLRAIIVVGGPALPGTHDFDELLAGAKPTCEPAPTVADDICYWGYTSGSTGKPKAAVHSHAHFLAAADLVGVGVFGLEADDLVFSASKMFFAFGLGNSLYFPARVGGAAVLVPERIDAERAFEVVAGERPTVFFTVPTLYARMLAIEDAERRRGFLHLRRSRRRHAQGRRHVGLAGGDRGRADRASRRAGGGCRRRAGRRRAHAAACGDRAQGGLARLARSRRDPDGVRAAPRRRPPRAGDAGVRQRPAADGDGQGPAVPAEADLGCASSSSVSRRRTATAPATRCARWTASTSPWTPRSSWRCSAPPDAANPRSST